MYLPAVAEPPTIPATSRDGEPCPAGDEASPTRRSRPWIAAALALCAYLIITLALFPHVTTHLTDAFPADLGDPPSQAWILAWDAHALTTNPLRLYEANIFYPAHDTLAYQDTLLGLLPLAAPVLLLTGNAVLAYNLLFLLTFILCAWGAYLLARFLVGDARAAFVAGLVYGFSAYRTVHLSHLNLLSGMWIPFAVLCWERVRRGDRRYWAGVGLFFVLQALSALYYAAYLAVALAILFCLYLWRGRRGGMTVAGARSLLIGALATAAVSAAVLLPFFVPFFRVEHLLGASRGLGQAVYFSADLRDFLHSDALSLLYGWTGRILGVRPTDALQYLWPGALALALALWSRRFRPMPALPWTRVRGSDARRDYALLGLVAAVFCLGPFLKVLGTQTDLPLPYVLLYALPGFAGLRDPARFGAIYTLCLAILSAYGVAALLSIARLRCPRMGLIVTLGIALVVLAESWLRPLPVVPVPVGAAVPPVYRWLADKPAGTPVLELPIGLGDKRVWAQQAEMMYFATYHWHPLVNGTGGFAPPGYAGDATTYSTFPSPAALRLLRARHVRYVIVHPAWLGAGRAAAIRRAATRVSGVRLAAHWSGPGLRAADAYEVSGQRPYPLGPPASSRP